MRRLIPILVAALFSAVTFSAYAIDQGTQGNPPAPQKHAKKKKKSKAPTVQQGAPAAEGRGTPGGAAAGGAMQQGAPAAEGRGTPGGAAAGGAVTSPTPKGPGRSDNQ
jgi:hypothetical protein